MVKALLEHYPRHRTAHAAFLSTYAPASQQSHKVSLLPFWTNSARAELRVIRYLPCNLKGPEIAAELFVSTNTVRTHLRHIYGKLDVRGRAEAVERARQLGLLAPSHRRR